MLERIVEEVMNKKEEIQEEEIKDEEIKEEEIKPPEEDDATLIEKHRKALRKLRKQKEIAVQRQDFEQVEEIREREWEIKAELEEIEERQLRLQESGGGNEEIVERVRQSIILITDDVKPSEDGIGEKPREE